MKERITNRLPDAGDEVIRRRGSIDIEGIVALGGLLLIFVLAMLFALATYADFSSQYKTRSRVTVDGRVVFEGSNACIDVGSAGASTEVNIDRPPFCFSTVAHFVGRGISVEPIQ